MAVGSEREKWPGAFKWPRARGQEQRVCSWAPPSAQEVDGPQEQPQTVPRLGPVSSLPACNYPMIDVGIAAKGICVQPLWSFSNSPDLCSVVGAG